MPIDSNDFNDPSIQVFFTHVDGWIANIKLEGIFDPSNPEDFYKEYLGNMFVNMCRLPPTVTAGIIVPVQVINVSTKSQKRLVIASRAAIHYQLVVCDLKLAMMNWKALKEIYLQFTSLEDQKNKDDPDVPVMKKKYHYFVKQLI